jgi:hypothetical protein
VAQAECLHCGNMRPLLDQCPHCGSTLLPNVFIDTVELNLKDGQPSVEGALEKLTDYLHKSENLGIKAIVLIHGYGSSGEGGQIKRAVHHALDNSYFSDRVDEYFYGEHVPYGSPAYQTLTKKRPRLKIHLEKFKSGNAGITVLLLNSTSVREKLLKA